MRDEIVDEVREAREKYLQQFDNDLERMFEALKKKEQEHPELLVYPKPRESERKAS